MFSYYTSIILLSWMALGVLCILIRENGRISRADKRLLYATYALIAVSALAEWCGVQLDGRADTPRWLFKLVKCVDYILTPMAGGALVIQIRVNNRWQKALMAILGLNTAFQLISVFTGRMMVIDSENHYTHGPLYGVYMLVCLAIIAIVVVRFILYGRSYRRQNRWSLYAIIALSRLRREADKWRGGKGQGLKLAAGYALAADSPGLTSEKLVHEADLQMYEAKAEYYRKTGLDRRRPLS